METKARIYIYLCELLNFEFNLWWWHFYWCTFCSDWCRFELFLELIDLILNSPHSPPLPPQISCPQGIQEQRSHHNWVYESKCSSLEYPKFSINSKCHILSQQQSCHRVRHNKITLLRRTSVSDHTYSLPFGLTRRRVWVMWGKEGQFWEHCWIDPILFVEWEDLLKDWILKRLEEVDEVLLNDDGVAC